ncbi:MAG: hypothetical protein WD178_08895, partial [Actinomycetota bacterium]
LAALLGGRLADRLPSRLVLTFSAALVAAAPAMVQYVLPGPTALVYALVLGAGGSWIRTVEATLLPRWFGIACIGELRGVVLGVAVAASAVGPLVMATAHDLFGGYGAALNGLVVLGGVVTLAAALIHAPDWPAGSSSPPEADTPAPADPEWIGLGTKG